MSPGSCTESYPAFARIGLRENPGKNLNQVTCPDRDSNPGHLVSRPDALTVTPQLSSCMVVAVSPDLGEIIIAKLNQFSKCLEECVKNISPKPRQQIVSSTELLSIVRSRNMFAFSSDDRAFNIESYFRTVYANVCRKYNIHCIMKSSTWTAQFVILIRLKRFKIICAIITRPRPKRRKSPRTSSKSSTSKKKNAPQYMFPNSSHSCHYRRYRTYQDLGRRDTQHAMHVTGSVNRLRPVERSQCERKCHSAMEQRVNIKFCYKLGKTATETHGMLVQVYGEEAVSRKCVYEWFKRFRDGKETIEDEPRSGRPSTSRTPEMIEKVRQMLAQDRRLTLRLIAEELDISKDTVHTIVRDDLGKRKICSRFVPHKLTDEQKAKRMETSGDFISMCDQDPLVLKTIVTGDETWYYQFDPE
ncbi:hypothetical protein ANN_25322 [Periplaneta americana]|uniref:Mos1 transposase HTH domain-containing protein n=1 Tax=Periplaneta americana TaxID=6978 RepID=A0ABQ8S114_PERAM|nr:hypothetical protein ANN_25322 [Periplaneta americana]